MRKDEIKVGGHYKANVSGKRATVRVDAARESTSGYGRTARTVTVYDCTNLATGRKIVVRSAQRFIGPADLTPRKKADGTPDGRTLAAQIPNLPDLEYRGYLTATEQPLPPDEPEVEQRPDPTPTSSGTTNGNDSTKPAHSQPSAGKKTLPHSSVITAHPGGPASEPKSETESAIAPPAGSSGSGPLGSENTNVNAATSPLASLDRFIKPADPMAETVAGYKPTDEQREVLKAATFPGLKCLVLPAGAGAGKTSTLKMLEEVLAGSGQYTAFNRSLVAESKAKFRKARCSTTHGLAFATAGKRFSHRLNGGRVRSEQIARQLGIADLEITVVGTDGQPTSRKLAAGWLAGQVMMAIRRFCQSADPEITRRHFKRIDGIDADKDRWENNDVVRDYLLPYAARAWADLSSPTGTLPFNHDVYVKVWQLGQGPDRPLIAADYILLDEAQDTAPVFLDVLKQQTHALLIFVGDSNQAIYEWRGAVDAMAAWPDAPRRQLSQSFRFGQRVADVANSILAGLDEPTDLILKGLESLPSTVRLDNPLPNPRCVLTRTNAGAIVTVMEAQSQGKRTHLIASVDEIVGFVKAARDLQEGRSTTHADLGCFNTWGEVVEYSKTDEGQELRLWVRLIDEFGCGAIIAALESQTREEDADLVVCTAHKSKGREWVSVKLHSDFPPAVNMTDPDRKLLYVAATRAKMALDLSACTPFHIYRDKQTGEETAGIHIKWTGPMPVEGDQPQEATQPQQPAAGYTPAPAPAAVAPTHAGNGKVIEFSWANYNGKWRVGGPPGYSGKTVDVVRKNGSRSQERLGAVVKEYPERCIYELGR